MTTLLPVGTVVRVSQQPFTLFNGTVIQPPAPWIAKVVGYDIHCSKYELGRRYMGWSEYGFLDGGEWAFPGEVESLTDEQLRDHDADAMWGHTSGVNP